MIKFRMSNYQINYKEEMEKEEANYLVDRCDWTTIKNILGLGVAVIAAKWMISTSGIWDTT